MSQAQIRQLIHQQRAQLTQKEIQQASDQVIEYVINFISFEAPLNLAFYLPNKGEIDPTLLIEHAWLHGNDCYLPAIDPLYEKQLVFLNYTAESDLIENRYHIKEVRYDSDILCAAESLDIVFVPLVAFDEKCHRIGMGVGYYDRTFNFKLANQKQPPMLIGLAYEFQKVPSISPQSWDVPVDAVVSEKQLYVSQSN